MIDQEQAKKYVAQALKGVRVTDGGLPFASEEALNLLMDGLIAPADAIAILTGAKSLSGTFDAPVVS